MVLGRLVHYAADAVLLSAVLAGVRRSSGFQLDTTSITDPTMRGIADKYFGVGESIFDILQATAVNSNYFKKGQ
ncbi:hypothetical protein M407DRAFT_246608 [Tulasnella calospora MUT 4182]|uniref:DUF1748-domain-containing protein n=1 Tax=Tulasnella calospora MUT 4182 TaxID=1051891 RepID=A0A0C3Q4T8_9AGAM|nr:hypothetical protein M407DRAFT_246608 [Tulasnella calospora MUT 4182]